MTMQRRLFFLLIFSLLLAACLSTAAPALGIAGKPALVFIYTDG